MTGDLQLELDAVLQRDDVALAALDDEGFRTLWPPDLGVAAHRVVPLPPTRSTLIDLAVPADALAVLEGWEAAMAHGRAVATVRLREAPQHRVQLVYLDVRRATGVVVAAFVPDAVEVRADAGCALPAEALTTSQRPRSGSITKSLLGEVISADERFLMMTGWREAEVLGRRSTEVLHPEDLERALRAWLEMRSSGRPCRTRVRHLCSDGSWLWVELENRLETDPDGTTRVACDVIDVSEELAAHEAVRQSARLFRLLAEAMPVGVVRLEADGRTGFANARAAQALGLTLDPGQDAAAVLPDAATLLQRVCGPDRHHAATALEAALSGAPKASWNVVEVEVLTGGPEERRCRIEVTIITDTEGAPGALLCLTDTTVQHLEDRELQHRANTDALTGCANRAASTSAVQSALAARVTGAGSGVGLLFCDLDGFKVVNDTLGHAAGDELLIEVARRLRSLVRTQDVVGRLGGDEFVVVAAGVDQSTLSMMRDRLIAALSGEVLTSAGTARLGASAGAVLASPDDDAASLLARADAAMYSHKRRRRAGR